MKRKLLALLVCLAFLSSSGVASAAKVVGQPEINVVAPDNTLSAGDNVTLDVYLNNEGEIRTGGPADYESRVTTARGTTVELRSGDAPVEIKTAARAVGSVGTGSHGPYGFSVVVDGDAEAGVYRLPVDISYSYTRSVEYTEGGSTSPRYNDLSTTRTEYLRVVIEESAEFRVVSSSSDVAVGSTGRMSLTIENVGSEAARDSTVVVESTDTSVYFGNLSPTSEAFVGRWEVGETRTVEYKVGVLRTGLDRNYAVGATVNYEDADGVERSESLVTSLKPLPEQTFEITGVESSLSLGEEGYLRGSVANTGVERARGATLVLVSSPSNVVPQSSEHPLGDLHPEESRNFSFDVVVNETAGTGPQRFSFVVEYDNEFGDTVTSSRLRLAADVGARSRTFGIDTPNRSFAVDSDSRLEAVVTNNADRTVTGINVRLGVQEPLESDDNTAFVPRLAPGESTTVAFDLTVTNDAIPKTHSGTVDFSYTNPNGVTKVSRGYEIPIEVSQEGTSLPVVPIVVVIAAAVIGAIWWRRRS